MAASIEGRPESIASVFEVEPAQSETCLGISP
jgi:hypothetical protein